MNRLILVRHGHPDQMLRDMTGGWTESHLTDLGRRQAEAAAHRLAEMLDGSSPRLYTSDLSRARETAEIIAQALGSCPEQTPRLREQDLGEANNATTARAAELALNPAEGPVVDRVFFPAAETWRAMMQRVFEFLDRAQQETAGTCVAVSHAGAGTAVVFWWLGLSPDRWPGIQFELDLCSITELTVGEHGGRRVMRANDVRHLAGLEA